MTGVSILRSPASSIAALMLAACGQLAQASTSDATGTMVGGTPVLGASKVLELVLALFVVFAAVAVLAWLGKRLQQTRIRGGGLQVEAAIPVGPKERVVIVQADGQRLLLGVGNGTVCKLQVLSALEEAADREYSERGVSATGTAPGFAQLCNSLISRSSGR